MPREGLTYGGSLTTAERSATWWIDVLIWVTAWLLLAVALFYSLGPVPPGVNSFPHADKVFHASLYMAVVLTFLLAAVWRPGRGTGAFAWSGIWIVLGGISTGVLVELLQGAFFGRDAELADALADLAGVTLGYGLWLTLRLGFRERR
jgi:VanZ family protein